MKMMIKKLILMGLLAGVTAPVQVEATVSFSLIAKTIFSVISIAGGAGCGVEAVRSFLNAFVSLDCAAEAYESDSSEASKGRSLSSEYGDVWNKAGTFAWRAGVAFSALSCTLIGLGIRGLKV